jgi:hypothetical protein
MNTILYYTDNTLEEPLAKKCREMLVKSAGDLPIVSVSQKPINLGKNIYVGEIGRSWVSLYKQLLAGLAEVKTKYVVMAEHDVLYTPEHLNWTPPSDDVFWYNHNCWLVQWHGNHPDLEGMYSYWPQRYALSQLICAKELLETSTKEVMELLNMGLKTEKGMRWHGEPGLVLDTHRAFLNASSGRPIQLQSYLKKYLETYQSKSFSTKNPNLDIRHSANFTGPKRGKKRTFQLHYWGKFKDVIE